MLPSGIAHSPEAVLAKLLSRNVDHVADISERLHNAGFDRLHLPNWDSLSKVQPRSKGDLVDLQRARPLFGGLAANEHPDAIFWSPGGLCEPVSAESIQRLAELLHEAGVRPGDRVANGFSYHFTPAGLLVHQALIQAGACVLPIGPQQTPQAAEFLTVTGASAYVGTATHLKLLLEACDSLAPEIKRPQLRFALAGAEPFGDDLRRSIETQWGVPCLDFYGFAEAGIIALECETHTGLHMHPEVLTELVTPGTGQRTEEEVGELLVSQDSSELPLLRFGTGDLVRLIHAPCACGRNTPRIQPLGRIADSARVRGMLLHGSQLRAFARRTGLSGCVLTIGRASHQDVLEIKYSSESQDLNPEQLAQKFREMCRLRVDGISEDPSLQQGEVRLQDIRTTSQP